MLQTLILSIVVECAKIEQTPNYTTPIITGLITTILFIGNILITKKYRKHDFRRTWYMDSIIKPNLSTLEKFLEETKINYLDYCNYRNTPNLSVENLQQKKIKLITAFTASKSETFSKLITLLRDDFRDKYEELNKLILGIQEIYSKSLELSANDDFLDKLEDYRSKIYRAIYDFIA